jgi:hypothetical protein
VQPSPANPVAFNLVQTLIHADGTNGQNNNLFVDSSASNFTMTKQDDAANLLGGMTQGTFNPYLSCYSADCRTAQTPQFTIAFNTVFTMGTGDFTIECWVNPYNEVTATTRTIIDIFDTGNVARLGIRLTTANKIDVCTGSSLNTSILLTTGVLTANVWTHIAVVRSGTGAGQLKVYINGVADATTATSATSFACSSDYVYLCAARGAGVQENYYNGLISNLRVVKGVAVYTGTFTVPTSVLTSTQSANPYGGSNTAAITGTATSLLTFIAPRYIDQSSNALTMYRGRGSNTVAYPWFVPYTPIPKATIVAPTVPVAYSSAAFAGSIGNTSNVSSFIKTPITTALTFTGDLTIDFWMYTLVTNNTTRQEIVDLSDGTDRCMVFFTAVNGTLDVFNSIINGNTTTVEVSGCWTHVAFSSNSGSNRLFVNGVQDGSTTTVPIAFGGMCGINVGGPYNNAVTSWFHGYLSQVRVLQNTGLYTSNFTPPTSPVTAVTNTVLLLNGTNAAIQDTSMSQNFYNVTATDSDNALTTTGSNVKFGTAALYCQDLVNWAGYFGQSYSSLDNVPIEFGTGNYTIEGWAKTDGNQTTRGIFQIYTFQGTTTPPVLTGTVGGLALGKHTSTNLRFWNGANDVSSAVGTFADSTYIHFAIVRNGTGASNTKVYINGTANASLTVTDSTNYTGYYLAFGAWFIGASNTYGWRGWLDEFRISKYAVYTSNFTPYAYAFPDV